MSAYLHNNFTTRRRRRRPCQSDVFTSRDRLFGDILLLAWLCRLTMDDPKGVFRLKVVWFVLHTCLTNHYIVASGMAAGHSFNIFPRPHLLHLTGHNSLWRLFSKLRKRWIYDDNGNFYFIRSLCLTKEGRLDRPGWLFGFLWYWFMAIDRRWVLEVDFLTIFVQTGAIGLNSCTQLRY